MKEKTEKSGQKKSVRRRRKSLRFRLNEKTEQATEHFSVNFVARLANIKSVRLWVVEWALLVLLILLLTIVQIFWYDQAHQVTAFVRGGTYNEGSIGDINSLNPLYAVTDSEKIAARLLFANIVSPDGSGHEKNELAKSITVDESGKVWTLVLRDGLKWSDGEKITAEDVVYSIELIRDRTARTTIPSEFDRVKMEIVDELTVKFTLPSVYLDFMESLEFAPVPKHILGNVAPALVYENEFSINPVGSGPFVVNAMAGNDTSNMFSKAIYMNRNENYFRSTTKLDSFVLKIYKSTDEVSEALRAGNIQGTGALNELNASDFEGTSIKQRTGLLNGGAYAFINTTRVNKVKVRQAIQQGVDMAVVRTGLDDSRKLDYPFLRKQGETLKYPKLKGYNLEEAKKLLADAGYKYVEEKLVDENDMPVILSVAAKKQGILIGVAERYTDQLKKLGFEVNLRLIDEKAENIDFFASVVQPRDYDILLHEVDLGINADPFIFYSSTQAGKSGWNFSNYNNGLVDDALLSARVTTSGKLKDAKFNAFLEHWVNDVPAVGLYRSTMEYYYQNNVEIFSDSTEMTDALDRFYDVHYWAVERKNVEMTP